MINRIAYGVLAALGLAVALALAGCSGGGGSSTPAGSNNTGGTTQPQSLTTQEAAQAGTEAVFDPVETGDSENGLYNGTMGPTYMASVVSLQSAADGVCHNGVERTVTVISSTEKKYETKYFYDKACTELARDVVADVVNNGTGESVTRLAKNYAANGTLLSTRTTAYSITGSTGNFTKTETSSLVIGTSTTPSAQYGHTETVATSSGSNVSSVTGNGANIVNNGNPAIDESFGHSHQLSNVTKTVDTSGNVTFAGSRTAQEFKGAIGTLVLSASSPFAITPAADQFGTASIAGSITFDTDGELTNVSINATLYNGDAIAAAGSGDPITVTGTVKDSSGTTIATFTVDQYGDGIITYSNGSQGLIYDWHVVK
jgi:hypothetical protein